jgi:hypothetical protein
MSIIKLEGLNQERACTNGVLMSYADYTRFQESPPDFHIWTGIAIVSSLLGRNVWVDQGYFKVYPNLFIVLVGKSAIAKKSSALGIGLDMLTEVDHEFPLFSQKVTTESFIQFLAERTTKFGKAEGLVYSPEFSTFLGRSDKDQTLIQTLTDYYDCPNYRSYSTRGRGKEEMKDVCLNLLAGSTPEWLKSSLPEDSIGGGFLSRLLLINRNEPGNREPFPADRMTPEVSIHKKNVLNDLKIVRSMQGEYKWTQEAKSLYSTWYKDYLDKEQAKCNPFMDGYYGRKGTSVIKMAMICAASLSSDLEIKSENVEFAISLLNSNEVFMKQVVENISQSEMGQKIDYVRNIVWRKPNLPHFELIRKVSRKLNSMELRQIMDTLIEGGEVIRTRESTGGVVYNVSKDFKVGE